jgi:translation initiation factor 2D
MFKKPASLKPAAPLRASECRRLAEEVAAAFALDLDSAKALVPKGILHSKATTSNDAHVSIYSSESDPLWFRIGKGNDGLLVPTCLSPTPMFDPDDR